MLLLLLDFLLLDFLLPLLLLLLRLNLPRRTRAKHLPAAKRYGPKGRTKSKMHFPGPDSLLLPLPLLLPLLRLNFCFGERLRNTSRQQNSMALKDEPSPKCISRGRNIPSKIQKKILCSPSF